MNFISSAISLTVLVLSSAVLVSADTFLETTNYTAVTLSVDTSYCTVQDGGFLCNVSPFLNETKEDYDQFDIGMGNDGNGYLKVVSGPASGNYCMTDVNSNQLMCDQSDRVIAFQFTVFNNGRSFTMRDAQNSGLDSFCSSAPWLQVACQSDDSSKTTFSLNKRLGPINMNNVFIKSIAKSTYWSKQYTMSRIGFVCQLEVQNIGTSYPRLSELFSLTTNVTTGGVYITSTGVRGDIYCDASDLKLYCCNYAPDKKEFFFDIYWDNTFSFAFRNLITNTTDYFLGDSKVNRSNDTSLRAYFKVLPSDARFHNVTITGQDGKYCSIQNASFSCNEAQAENAQRFNINQISVVDYGSLQALSGPIGSNFCDVNGPDHQVRCDKSSTEAGSAFHFQINPDPKSFQMVNSVNGERYCSSPTIQNPNIYCNVSDASGAKVFYLN